MGNETIYAVAGLVGGFVAGYAYYKCRVKHVVDRLSQAGEIVRRTYRNCGYNTGLNNNTGRMEDSDTLIDIAKYIEKKFGKNNDLSSLVNRTRSDIQYKIEGIYNEKLAEYFEGIEFSRNRKAMTKK